MKSINVGDVFGSVTVVELLDELAVNGNEWVKCQCSCGEVFYSKKSSLLNGTVSCCGLCNLKQQYNKRRIQSTCECCGRPISRGKFCSDRCLFLSLMKETDNDCIEFNSDSATIFPTFKGEFAYILEWEYIHGAIPNGYRVIHTCGNPRCVNPQHLKLVKVDSADDVASCCAYKDIELSVKKYKDLKNLKDCTSDFVSKRFINKQGRFLFAEFREYFGFAFSTAWVVKKRLGLEQFPNYYIRASMAQSELFDWLPISNKTLNDRTVIPPHELDIFLSKNNIAIEYDGVYWHNDTEKNRSKYEQLKALGVRFFDIFEFENQIVWKGILLRALKLLEYKVTATFKDVDAETATNFIKHNSVENSEGDTYFGVYTDTNLVGIITKRGNIIKIILGVGVEVENLEELLRQNFSGCVIELNNRYELPEDYVHDYVLDSTTQPQDWYVYSRKIYNNRDIINVIQQSSKYNSSSSYEENLKSCKVNHVKDLGKTFVRIS